MKKVCKFDYLWLALYAFAGLGSEMILLGIETLLFAIGNAFSVPQKIVHWLLTMLCWGVIIALLVRSAKKQVGFDLLQRGHTEPRKRWMALGCVLLCIGVNALDWHGLKIVGEFQSKGWLLFMFQYLYYAFEIGLVVLIVAFGQRFAEACLKRTSRFPFGGVLLCLTWGVVHWLSKGSLTTALGVMFFALIYGELYLLLDRDLRLAYGAMLAAFII